MGFRRADPSPMKSLPMKSLSVKPLPMLRLAVPFALGIAGAERFVLPLWFLAAAFCICGVVAVVFRSGAALVAMLAAAGFGLAQYRMPVRSVPLGVGGVWAVDVEGIAVPRGRRVSVDGVIRAWRPYSAVGESGQWYPACDRVSLRCDSLVVLSEGERICCAGVLRPLRGGSEGYRRTMARRGFVGTLFVGADGGMLRVAEERPGLHVRAAARLKERCSPSDAGAVVRAMTVADRSDLSPGLRADYARSGMSHLLAVSGLHVGIVFWLVNCLLRWTTLWRRGHLLRNAGAVVAVWSYVAVAGFPPSAVRAAVMASLLQGALAAGSEYVGLNALAAAAFGMLIWNPAWLGDVGFRLSFLAVAAILAWGVPLCRRLHTGNRIVDALVDTWIVGLAASLATAPLVSHLFGIVPVAGALLGPVVIPLAGATVLCGLLVLLLPVGAPLFRLAGEGAAALLDVAARWVAGVPGGAVDHALSGGWTAVCYGVFVVATVVAWRYEPKKTVHLSS